MQNIKDCERFKEATSVLSSDLHKLLLTIDPHIKACATEIRIRLNKPLCVCCGKTGYYIEYNGLASKRPDKEKSFIVTQKQLIETFQRICGFSLYSYQKELKQGYITVRGGHRVGICGTAVINNDEIFGMRDITSLNLRIAREIIDCAASLYSKIANNLTGMLIVGPPASGKTTVLRDLARRISLSGRQVCIIDERGEISGAYAGFIANDIGFCDVLNGYKKSDAMLRAMRSMAPDVIICDEIGSEDDLLAIDSCVNTGITIIASVHADSLEALYLQKRGKNLINSEAFSYAVMLSSKDKPGNIEGIYSIKRGEQNDKADRSNSDNNIRGNDRTVLFGEAFKKG